MNSLQTIYSAIYRAILPGIILFILPILGGAAPRFPFPQHVHYSAGSVKPNHVSQSVQDNDVRAYYNFWKAHYLNFAGQNADGLPMYRVNFGKNHPLQTVSEGQGYGMIITALMAGYDANARAYFDGLWRFARANPSIIDKRLMAYKVTLDSMNNILNNKTDSAFDGDADMAYGLLLASRQWGDGGKINYLAESLRLLGGILESTIGPSSFLPMLGDWIGPNNATPDPSTGAIYNQWTPRTSDFMVGHFRAFSRATGSPRWDKAVSKTLSAIAQMQANHSPATGLLPDFIEPVSLTNHSPMPARCIFLEGSIEEPYDCQYYYNAGRDPWRIGTDALLTSNSRSLGFARKISAWAEKSAGGDPNNIKAGYSLGGNPLPTSDYFTIFFAAPFGVAAMLDSNQQVWLNQVYRKVRNLHEDYYEDSVTLLCMLVMTGNFWDPSTR